MGTYDGYPAVNRAIRANGATMTNKIAAEAAECAAQEKQRAVQEKNARYVYGDLDNQEDPYVYVSGGKYTLLQAYELACEILANVKREEKVTYKLEV